MNDIPSRYERDALDAEPDPGRDDEAQRATSHERRRPRRRTVIVAVSATALLLLAGGLAALLWQQNGASAAPTRLGTPVSETAVAKGSVVVETNAAGTLQYSAQRALASGPSGVVTSLLPVGTSVSAGSALYTVNTSPVVLLSGSIPAWRTFESGMAPGDDVRQLEENLAAFGLFSGDVDTEFTALTARAIRSWQKSLGVEQTGTIERSMIVFSTADIRIAEHKSVVGATVGEGAELYVISSNEKSVSLHLKLSDQRLAATDAPVTIMLPTGAETPGLVTAVGAPTEQAGPDPSAPKSVVLPVMIRLADPAAAAEFDRASVTVRFSSTLSAEALTVPVEALLAIDDASFAVEIANADPEKPRTRIPVTTGAFGSGRVEISGAGISEGLLVVVPTR